jgi:uncharacterized protein
VLAFAGGLPGGGSGTDLKRVFEPFPAAPRPSGPSPAGSMRIARDVQQTWRQLFGRAGIAFRPAKLVVVDRVTRSGCGHIAPKAVDAFYCDVDTTLSFSGGRGDAYLIGHVYAHHVQDLLGITEQIARGVEASPEQAGDLWRKHELQADCLAGVWAHSALRGPEAASAAQLATIPVGPDHAVDRENWASAPREQRARWFRRGLQRGDAGACEPFTR